MKKHIDFNCPICNEPWCNMLFNHLDEKHGICVLNYDNGQEAICCPCGWEFYPDRYSKEFAVSLNEVIYPHLTQMDEKHRLILMMAAKA